MYQPHQQPKNKRLVIGGQESAVLRKRLQWRRYLLGGKIYVAGGFFFKGVVLLRMYVVIINIIIFINVIIIIVVKRLNIQIKDKHMFSAFYLLTI